MADAIELMRRKERERIGRLLHEIGLPLLAGSKDDAIRGAFCMTLAHHIKNDSLEGRLNAHPVAPDGGQDSSAE